MIPRTPGQPRNTRKTNDAKTQSPETKSKTARTSPVPIVRENSPENLEFPFESLDGLVTPNELFYVRSHFPTPKTDLRKWRLKIEGDAVERGLELSFDDLLQMPEATATVTLECAGNGRIFIPSKQEGVQWGPGAVGTAEWSGVWLREILDRVGLRPDAREVVLEGADCGELDKEPKTPGKIHYSHSVPIEKARENVMLAHKMNGEQLPVSHGYPLRAIVPGWYGMACVKWLNRIIVTKNVYTGYFQTADYSYWDEAEGLPPQMKPVTEIEVRAQIARPAFHEVVSTSSRFLVRGAAWSGEAKIIKVEISADGGKSWNSAKLTTEPAPYIWTLWECEWRTPSKPGECFLMARATDDQGNTQPLDHDSARGGYMANFVLPVPVHLK